MLPRRRLARSSSRNRIVLGIMIAVGSASLGCGGPQNTKPTDLSTMVRIPAGEFTMGRDDGDTDERPARQVYLDEFYIDRTEVTNRAFKAFCDATGRLMPNNPTWAESYLQDELDSPVLNITWDQAQAYCAWAKKRLPSEAEWEKAARGTDGRLYPWGVAWMDSAANLAYTLHTDDYERAAPVGSFPRGASPYGVLDMAGNVWEWTADWFATDAYSTLPAKNPRGPAGPTGFRVVRGGGYSSPKTDAEVSNRSKNVPDRAIHHTGCRCAWSPR